MRSTTRTLALIGISLALSSCSFWGGKDAPKEIPATRQEYEKMRQDSRPETPPAPRASDDVSLTGSEAHTVSGSLTVPVQ